MTIAACPWPVRAWQHRSMERAAGGVPAGVEVLRARRGRQRISFADVADHLADFADLSPDDAAVIDRLGRFLADVEGVDHDHDADLQRGLG